ncbi:MAG: antitoxin family protein [Acidobacteriota bacterium]|nr:antitoxin family protein [Acidobacteriota bacterium]
MNTAIEAVYEKGLLRPLRQLNLVEGEKVSVVLIEPVETKLDAMREAMNDPLFLADLREVAEDFQHVDAEVVVR